MELKALLLSSLVPVLWLGQMSQLQCLFPKVQVSLEVLQLEVFKVVSPALPHTVAGLGLTY